MSIRGQILAALADRLKQVTVANGYGVGVATVLGADTRVQMSQELTAAELPAVIIFDGPEQPTREMQIRDSRWTIVLQLVHGDVTDTVMLDFVEAIGKAIMANSPVTEVADGGRSIHPRVIEFESGPITPDLNLVEGNRIYTMQWGVRTRLKAWEF